MKALAVEALDPFTGQRRTHKRDALPALYGHQTPECGTVAMGDLYLSPSANAAGHGISQHSLDAAHSGL